MLPLPIPFPEQGGLRKTFVGNRSVRRRLACSLAWRSWANDGIRALNSLHDKHSNTAFSAANAAQASVALELGDSYRQAGKPPSEFCPAGAFRELCGKALPYLGEDSGPAMYEKGLVSLPARVDNILDVDAFLRARNSNRLIHHNSSMLVSDTEAAQRLADAGINKPHIDSSFNSGAVYGDFLRDLHSRNLLSWKSHRKSFLGLFFVRKKNGTLRLILDTRVANCQFSDHPPTALPTPAACSQIEAIRGDVIYFASGDIEIVSIVCELPNRLLSSSPYPVFARSTLMFTLWTGSLLTETRSSHPS